MRTIFFLGLFFLNAIGMAAIPIVFIHLGNGLPGYYYTAIRQAQLYNEESDIYLVVHSRNWTSLKKKLPFNNKVHVINANKMAVSKKHQEFAPIARTEVKFWRYTLERFYVLEELMRDLSLDELIHLEGDNMVYCNLTELLPVFRKACPEIGIPFLSDTVCTPGIVYIGNRDVLSAFTQRIPSELLKANMFSDMHFFANMSWETGRVKSLPAVPPNYRTFGGSYKTLQGTISLHPEIYSHAAVEFGGVFDAGQYGIFLDGVSDIHAAYKIPKRLVTSTIDPSFFKYEWEKDTQGRRRLCLAFENEVWPIHVLHVNSKDLEKFASDR